MFWGRFTRIFDQYSNLMSNKATNLKEKIRIALTSTAKVISGDFVVNEKNSKNILEWIDIDVILENKNFSIIINNYNSSKIKLIQSY